MKKTFVILLAVLLSANVFAQTQQKMSYQAVIRNSNGILVTNTQIGMEVNIRQGSASGPVVYSETQTPTTNANGLASIEIGGGAGFSNINWANSTYYIETKTAVVAPLTIYTIEGASQILSVPYALNAKTAGSIIGGFAGYGGLVHYVGELYGGGIVVSVWLESGIEKGLIASLTDISDSAQWSSITGTLIGTTAQSPTAGQANTIAIVAQGDISGAAYLCDNYAAGGFSDWYLPAVWEINKCYDAGFVVNTILGAVNGFQLVCHYWSSTEINYNHAQIQNFYTGNSEYHINKSETARVRAVRRF